MSDSLPESNSVKVIKPQHIPRIVKDRTGQRFGLWIVLRFHEFLRAKSQWVKLWWCRCDCGIEKPVRGADLVSGASSNCGCKGRENGIAKAADLSGKVYGRLTVLSFAGHRAGRRAWLCRCECGSEKEITTHELRSGDANSCGCLHREIVGDTFRTHGMVKTRTYRIWAGMKARCEKESATGYHDYGKRGIKVCERWQAFENFLEDMGECPPGHSIDRENVDGNYCPENCRWATAKMQANNKRNSVYLQLGDKRMTLGMWAEELNVSTTILKTRMQKGWSDERVLTTPFRK